MCVVTWMTWPSLRPWVLSPDLIIKVLTKLHICLHRYWFQPVRVPSTRIRSCSCSWAPTGNGTFLWATTGNGTFLWESPNHPCAGLPLCQWSRWRAVQRTWLWFRSTQHSCRHRPGHGNRQPCRSWYVELMNFLNELYLVQKKKKSFRKNDCPLEWWG